MCKYGSHYPCKGRISTDPCMMLNLSRNKPVSLRLLLLYTLTISLVLVAVWWAVTGRSNYPVIVRFKLWEHEGCFATVPVVFSPSENRLLAASDHFENVGLWKPGTGEQLLAFEKSLSTSADALAFTPDSSQLVAANSYGEVRIWDVKGGSLVEEFSFAHEPLKIVKDGANHPCSDVVLSPNAARIACSYPNEDAIGIWSVTQKVEERSLKQVGRLAPLLFSADGSFLVLTEHSQSGKLAIWDLQQSRPAPPFGSLGDIVWSACLSSDNRVLATGRRNGVIKLWDVTTGEEIQMLQGGIAEPIDCLSFTPDGRVLAAGMGRTVHPWWTAFTGRSWLFENSIGRVEIWSVATGRPLENFDEPTGSAVSLSYSPDGHTLVIGCWDGTVSVRKISFRD